MLSQLRVLRSQQAAEQQRARSEARAEDVVSTTLDWIIHRIESDDRKEQRRLSTATVSKAKGSTVSLMTLIEAGFLEPGPAALEVTYQVRVVPHPGW